ncbi:hypothetical protein DL93DRAFT_960441 [Clavulina sp. PMI_390]|nr:hypothetical protein DL93DRAFT_960441 [Clavulina sp. PMI_390]
MSALQTCKALYQIFTTHAMWASIVKRLINEHYIAPHSFSIEKMTVEELKAMATQPYRFEQRIRHPPPPPEGTPSWYEPTVRFQPKGGSLQITLRSGNATLDPTSPTPPPAINTYSFHPLTGGRWVLGIPRSISGDTISMEHRAPAARILCWDLTQVSQNDTELQPVAWLDIAPRSDHIAEIQYDDAERTTNILIVTVPK